MTTDVRASMRQEAAHADASPGPHRLRLHGPLYPRVLHLRHIHPNGWQRALLVEGSMIVGAVAALADVVTAWAPFIAPVAVAAVVKFHDVLAGVLATTPVADPQPAAVQSSSPAEPAVTLTKSALLDDDDVGSVRVIREEPAHPDTQAIAADVQALEQFAEEYATWLRQFDGEADTFALVLGAGDIELVAVADLARFAADPATRAVAIVDADAGSVRVRVDHRAGGPVHLVDWS